MSEAPKKIYIDKIYNFWYDKRDFVGDTEYIRSDLVNKMREACEAMVKAYPYSDIVDGKLCTCPTCKAYRLGVAALEAGKVGE